MHPKLGILAGGGELPRLLIQACREAGRDVFVIAFKGQCDPQTTEAVDHAWVRLGASGTSIALLKNNGVEELVMAGRISRPSVTALMPDVRTVRFLAGGFFNKGDDGLLRGIIKTLEEDEGFRFVGVHNVMPELLTPEGPIGSIAPTEADTQDIQAATRAAKHLGAADLGQAAVCLGGQTIALEDRDGTDAMLHRLIEGGMARGGILAKMCKPGQERRADLPAIGLTTVENAHKAGLKGIVVEAGASVIVRRAEVAALADEKGLFVVGIKS